MQQVTEADKEIIRQWFTEDVSSVDEFINKLSTEYEHDYGTVVHAMTAVAIQALRKFDNTPQGGITGFQASAIMWTFIRNWMHHEGPLKLLHYNNMLYPQYADSFAKKIDKDTWKHLQDSAREKLAGDGHVHPNVRAHWVSIVEGNIPFGYTLAKEEDWNENA